MNIEICFYCGAEIGDSEWALQKHIDHYIPKSKGGSNDRDNLVPTCCLCNLDKRDMEPGAWKDKCFIDALMAVSRLKWLFGNDPVEKIKDQITENFIHVPLLGSPGIGAEE